MPRPSPAPTHNTIIKCPPPTLNGGTLEVHRFNDQRTQVMSGCHFTHPKDSLKLKFHQEVVCPALAKHGYIFFKDVTASAKIMDKSNIKFPRNTDQAKFHKPAAKRVSDDSSLEQISARHVHSPSISNTTIDSTIPPASINNSVLLMPNRAAQ